ncbi:hypothetical protein Trydic_g7614 [Trypoxylus dichotomus]
MTDSLNFGPEWLRILSSDGSTTGGTGGGARYQLSGYRYGREEMLGLYEKGFKPPASLFSFTTLYSEQPLVPLVLMQTTEEERTWPSRAPMLNSTTRGGRGTSLERGGRISRGRGSYQSYGRNVGSYESSGGWDNWRRNRPEEDEDWRSSNQNRGPEKWGRSTSWRDGDKMEERGGGGPQEKSRNWHENSRGHGAQRRVWDNEDLPEWATEHLGEGGGTFDSSGAYHGSDEEKEQKRSASNKKDILQKSSSQHNISAKQPPLTTSKSAISLSKQKEVDKPNEVQRDSSPPPPPSKINHQDIKEGEKQDPDKQKSEADQVSAPLVIKDAKTDSKVAEKKVIEEGPPNLETTNSNASNNSCSSHNGTAPNTAGSTNRVEEDFDRLQEDLVSKLVVEEESPKAPQLNSNINMSSVGTTTQPPPNLVPPIHDQWYYQDPQGDLQGPFVSTEMAEWFKAGYFSNSLRVRRHCDNSFYTLGDLVRICNGNPFLTTVRISPLKETAKIPEQDLLNLHLLQAQLALRHVPPRGYKPDWTGLSALQQRDLLSQRMLTPQMSPVDLQYLQQTVPPPPTATNPLMHIINQMQQANKLPGQPTLPEQPANTIPVQIDPLQALVQQMHSLQRIQPPVTGIPGIGLPPNIQNENLVNNLSGLHGAIPGSGIAAPNLSGLSNNLSTPVVIPTPLPPKPPTLETMANTNDSDPINSLLRQLQSKQLQQSAQIDTLWQQNQFIQAQTGNQWQQQPPSNQPQQPQQVQPVATPTSQPIPATPELPISMWDIQQPATAKPTVVPATNVEPVVQSTPPTDDHSEKEQNQIQEQQQVTPTPQEKEIPIKEDKRKKEQEEKQIKKEAEEKKKQEQKRLDQEKKAAEEKRKKEEEKRKREEEKLKKMLEKAKKESEEKKQKEMEEKRRLKELKKSEEEAKKRAEEQKRLELEQQERERREQQKQVEVVAKQTQEPTKLTKIAPWSQSNVSSGPSLADIQKAEREKRAEQVLLQQQRAQQQQNLEQQTIEKPSSMQLSWANKPIQPRQVKSLAEIQAEEQERLAKQAAESRLAQQQKEKETGSLISAGIWHGQNLTWANNPSTQWSSAAAGFWDDSTSHHQTSVHKPSSVTKSNSNSAMIAAVAKQQSKQTKTKSKKDEVVSNKTSNGPATEEFTAWCTKALANINSIVDIPTFVGFLRDIESAADVKEYCREYLGDNPATHNFAMQFLEKRRSFKPKVVAHKDDMCSPAPAITPNSQHNSDFQEVKGKGKKTKKSKMTKVDASRILGFSVTAAQDRINISKSDEKTK